MQQRTFARRAAPTMLFVVLAVWVAAVFMIVGRGGHQSTPRPSPVSVQQAQASHH